jgi:hypothetical protein
METTFFHGLVQGGIRLRNERSNSDKMWINLIEYLRGPSRMVLPFFFTANS